MSQNHLWYQQESIQTGLSTELNSLANATLSSLSSAIDQDSPLAPWITLQVDITWGSNPSAGGYVAVYGFLALDGTNYATGHQDYASQLLAQIPVRAVTSQQVITAPNIFVGPWDFKLALYNGSGQALPASGSTVKYRRHNLKAVDA